MNSSRRDATKAPNKTSPKPTSILLKIRRVVGFPRNPATNGGGVARATASHRIQNSFACHVISNDGNSTVAYSSSASSLENSDLQSIDTAMATVHSDDFFTSRRIETHARSSLVVETDIPSKHYTRTHEIQLVDGYFEYDSGVPSVSSDGDDESQGRASRNTHGREQAREVNSTVRKASSYESVRTPCHLSRCRELRRKDWDKRYRYNEAFLYILTNTIYTRHSLGLEETDGYSIPTAPTPINQGTNKSIGF